MKAAECSLFFLWRSVAALVPAWLGVSFARAFAISFAIAIAFSASMLNSSGSTIEAYRWAWDR